MAIEFPNKSALSFGTTPTTVSIQTSRTWMAWIKITAQQELNFYHTIFVAEDVPGGWGAWSFLYFSNNSSPPTTYLDLTRDYTVQGVWRGTANLTIGTWYHVAVTYSEGVSNDPVIYLNGSPVSVTEIVTPLGTVEDDSDSLLYVGGWGTGDKQSRIIIAEARIYPFIASADDIATIYASRCMGVHPAAGLPVFAPTLYGAAGLAHPDGMTLAAGNIIRDPMSGAECVPAGSPILRAETVLSICP